MPAHPAGLPSVPNRRNARAALTRHHDAHPPCGPENEDRAYRTDAERALDAGRAAERDNPPPLLIQGLTSI